MCSRLGPAKRSASFALSVSGSGVRNVERNASTSAGASGIAIAFESLEGVLLEVVLLAVVLLEVVLFEVMLERTARGSRKLDP